MERPCDVCGTTYTARRASSRYCSERCKKRAQRARGGVGALAANPPAPGSSA
jgi:hypothetical protein